MVIHSSDARRSDREEREPVAFTPSSVAPSAVPTLPADGHVGARGGAGAERIADIRLYSSRDSAEPREHDAALRGDDPRPSSDDAYVSVSADDSATAVAQPMRCTIFVGDVVVSTSVGTRASTAR